MWSRLVTIFFEKTLVTIFFDKTLVTIWIHVNLNVQKSVINPVVLPHGKCVASFSLIPLVEEQPNNQYHVNKTES
jgi:hypothetical protein